MPTADLLRGEAVAAGTIVLGGPESRARSSRLGGGRRTTMILLIRPATRSAGYGLGRRGRSRTLQNSRQIADPAVMQESTIALTTPRAWIGDPRLGTFVVYLDGKRAGALGPKGSLRLQCAAGLHRVTARQWWYISRPLEVDLAPEREVRLTIDIVRDGSFLRRILLLMVMPWRAVTVQARRPGN